MAVRGLDAIIFLMNLIRKRAKKLTMGDIDIKIGRSIAEWMSMLQKVLMGDSSSLNFN